MTIKCSLGHENPDGSAYCDECGESLVGAASPATVSPEAPTVVAVPTAGTQQCPSCGAANPAGESFCSNCGQSLLGGASAPAAAAPVPAGSAATATQARLIVEADNQEFDISGKDNVTIGREDAMSNMYPDIDLTPHGGEEGGVSRMHARIFLENGQYMLEDENSTNRTFLNRQGLDPKKPILLHDNDEIRLGRVLLRFKTS